MDGNLEESLDMLFVIFVGIAMFAGVISLLKNNKTFTVVRVTLNAFAVILGVLSGNGSFALFWVFMTVISLVELAKMNGKDDKK